MATVVSLVDESTLRAAVLCKLNVHNRTKLREYNQVHGNTYGTPGHCPALQLNIALTTVLQVCEGFPEKGTA